MVEIGMQIKAQCIALLQLLLCPSLPPLQIAQHLSNQFNFNQVKEAIEFLSNEGHIYSTVDDQHYKTCG